MVHDRSKVHPYVMITCSVGGAVNTFFIGSALFVLGTACFFVPNTKRDYSRLKHEKQNHIDRTTGQTAEL